VIILAILRMADIVSATNVFIHNVRMYVHIGLNYCDATAGLAVDSPNNYTTRRYLFCEVIVVYSGIQSTAMMMANAIVLSLIGKAGSL